MDTHTSDSLHSVFMRVLRTHRHTMHSLLQDQEVYPGQPPLLFALSKQDGQSQKELAERLHIKPATLTVMLNRTEKNGLVERKPDDKDQRISRVYLTDKGREAHEEVRNAFKIMEAQCFENFTVEDQELLRKLLLQMYDNLKKNLDLLQDKEQEHRYGRPCNKDDKPPCSGSKW
ncbi:MULTISPECIES: MarR family winged helix-turn-helix transcriptional regulator [unclassified Paenibacillus]|uniref:MarR family winged helix-turn-helix transcriptional regulator n=1 Tax=unclassified Paenibacillus TaxID=185978 RepID=UPI00363E4707